MYLARALRLAQAAIKGGKPKGFSWGMRRFKVASFWEFHKRSLQPPEWTALLGKPYANLSYEIFWRVFLGTAWSEAPFETEITEAGTVDVSCACAAPCSSRDQRWKTERFQLGNAEVQGCELLGVPQEVPSNLPNGRLC